MKSELTKAKYRCKKGCGCKMCKPQKGGHQNKRTVRDIKLAIGHDNQIREYEKEATILQPTPRA